MNRVNRGFSILFPIRFRYFRINHILENSKKETKDSENPKKKKKDSENPKKEMKDLIFSKNLKKLNKKNKMDSHRDHEFAYKSQDRSGENRKVMNILTSYFLFLI